MANEERKPELRLVPSEDASSPEEQPVKAGETLWIPGKWGRKPRGTQRGPSRWRDDAQQGWYLIQ